MIESEAYGPQTWKKLSRAAKTRTICGVEIKNVHERCFWSSLTKWTCVGKWTVEKLTLGKDLRKYMKRLVFPIIGTIITKRRICDNYLFLFNFDVTPRPRFHASTKVCIPYSSLSNLGCLDAPAVLPTKLCPCPQPSGGEYCRRIEPPRAGVWTYIP